MEDDRNAVGGDVQVAFDRVARLYRGFEGSERVLRPAAPDVVEAAMRNGRAVSHRSAFRFIPPFE